MKCKNCNAEIADGAKFCPECGAPQIIDNNKDIVGDDAAGDDAVSEGDGDKPESQSPKTEPKCSKKKWIWALVIAIVVIGLGLVAYFTHLPDKKPAHKYEDDEDYRYHRYERVSDTLPTEEVETVEVEETTGPVQPIAFPGNTMKVKFDGKWDEIDVRVALTIKRNGSDLTITGNAYYGIDAPVQYPLRGEGTYDGKYMNISVNEYNLDEDYTGRWDGTVCMCDGVPNFYGYFYDSDGTQHCWFDLYEGEPR